MMKTPTLYVILDILGQASAVTGHGKEKVDLPGLLEEGWRPISETSLGAAQAVLIRLEKEKEEKFGFGFGAQ